MMYKKSMLSMALVAGAAALPVVAAETSTAEVLEAQQDAAAEVRGEFGPEEQEKRGGWFSCFGFGSRAPAREVEEQADS